MGKIDFQYKTLSDSSTDELTRDDESDNYVCSVTMVAIVFKAQPPIIFFVSPH